MQQRKYFEIFATAGTPAISSKLVPHSYETLLDDMAYARIHGASFIHNAIKDYSFQYGNSLSIADANKHDRLFPLAVISSIADIEAGNSNYFNDLIDDGVCAFVTMPNSPSRSLLIPKTMEKVAETLIARKRPLIITDVNADEIYAKIVPFANAFPELNIIMHGSRWERNRLFIEAMLAADNLHFEISSNHTNNIMELTKKYFGMERVLYSSAWPAKSMGAMKSLIEYADISDAEKDLVAHGNACRLFGINPDSLELYDDAECRFDEIAKEADAGKPISVPVIDAHAHIVGDAVASNITLMVESDAKGVVKKMDRMGIDCTIVAPFIGIEYSGVAGNQETLDAIAQFPGRFLGYSTCNITDPSETPAVIETHLKHPDKFMGIKPYPPGFKFELKDERAREWFEFANEHHLAALIHAEAPVYTDQVKEIIELYPNITFILAHSGAYYSIAEYNAELAKKYDNVVLEITYTSTCRGMVEYLVELVGADRVLFGTDTAMRDSAPQLGWVCYANLPTEDKKKILAENIKRIINKCK